MALQPYDPTAALAQGLPDMSGMLIRSYMALNAHLNEQLLAAVEVIQRQHAQLYGVAPWNPLAVPTMPWSPMPFPGFAMPALPFGATQQLALNAPLPVDPAAPLSLGAPATTQNTPAALPSPPSLANFQIPQLCPGNGLVGKTPHSPRHLGAQRYSPLAASRGPVSISTIAPAVSPVPPVKIVHVPSASVSPAASDVSVSETDVKWAIILDYCLESKIYEDNIGLKFLVDPNRAQTLPQVVPKLMRSGDNLWRAESKKPLNGRIDGSHAAWNMLSSEERQYWIGRRRALAGEVKKQQDNGWIVIADSN